MFPLNVKVCALKVVALLTEQVASFAIVIDCILRVSARLQPVPEITKLQ